MARRSFWHYMLLQKTDFKIANCPHLKDLAEKLQQFAENKLITPNGKVARIFIMNLPPRHGKTYTLTNFCSWLLGTSKLRTGKTDKIVTVSYNDNLATKFSKFCRDSVKQQRGDPDDIIYGDIFPGVAIKRGDSAMKSWALNGEYMSYLGAGFKGELTGSGGTWGVIDDPIKSSEEAYNENTLESIWDFYKNTFRSRIEKGGKQIINHTRWREEDLAGRLMTLYGDDIYVHKRCLVENEVIERVPINDDNGNVLRYEDQTTGGDLLCGELFDWDDVYDVQKVADPETFRANYFQEPLDLSGKMYKYFRTYKYLPDTEGPAHCYTDTADSGDDFLCSIAYEVHGKQAYVIDVIYTKDAMEITEPELAHMLVHNEVTYSMIESNNGGRGFSRAVEKILLQEYDTNSTVMDWFAQSKNKEARILTQSNWCQKNIFFPEDWARRWPEFFRALTKYTKEGKNKHDDAPDALTGIAEQFAPSGGMPMFNVNAENIKGSYQWQQ